MIYLLRHGDAEDGNGDDAARRLTAKGARQARAAGDALAGLGAKIDACLTSPKLRAAETATLACEPLGLEPEAREELRKGGLAIVNGSTLLALLRPADLAAIAR